jgi:hypothetical protein
LKTKEVAVALPQPILDEGKDKKKSCIKSELIF